MKKELSLQQIYLFLKKENNCISDWHRGFDYKRNTFGYTRLIKINTNITLTQ